jgi:hypothetical protein
LSLSHDFLVPFSESVRIDGALLSDRQYFTDYQQGSIRFNDSLLAGRYAVVDYRFFTRRPDTALAIRRFEVSRDTSGVNDFDVILDDRFDQNYDAFWEESKVNTTGSISRGISLGNNQGLSVTSGLRLQLEGDLGDGLKIVGAITDENIPIQPDGTTQQISDFDKIFIRLQKDQYGLTIGDYEISHRNTRFANFYRNVQGLQLFYLGDNTRATVSGAVAKGQFYSNSFSGMDGVSGPYRLTGKNGERFFTVLAGSENVYLNGKLMVRGESNDYIIDYNSAEITFTARNVITNISRIVVDFEYVERNFNRSLLTGQVEQKLLNDRIRFRFSYGRDADNQNAPFSDLAAYNNIRDSLANIGDDLAKAVTSGVDSVGFSSLEPRYERRDTLINGFVYERYVLSRDSLLAVYRISFSFAGTGNGYYVKDQSGINNNVFRWVPPDSSGMPTGDYVPLRRWALPRLLQVANAQVDVQLLKNLRLYTETGVSSDDKNRLSPLDNQDNTAIASLAGLRWEDVRLTDSLKMTVDVSHQYVGQKYSNLDRVYKAEYGRIWNFDDLGDRTDEQIIQGQLRFNYKNRLQLSAETGLRNGAPGQQAVRQAYSLTSSLRHFLQGNYTFTSITNREEDIMRNSRWNRHEGDVFLKFWKLQPGVEIWIEDKKEERADSLSPGTFSFVDLKPYLRTVDTKVFQADVSFNYRLDKEFRDGEMRDKTRAFTHLYRWSLQPFSSLNIRNITSYRQLFVLDSLFYSDGLVNARSLNTNLQASYATPGSFLYTNFIYEASSEQVARKEVNFIEVNPGLGQYEWIDYNKDGIQAVDEFELSTNPLSANFIRIVRPTQDLFPTTRLGLTGNLRLDFRKVIKKSNKPLRELLRNIRLITNFRISQNKERGDKLGDFLIGLGSLLDDTTLIDANYNLRQDVNFFQNSPIGDLRITYLDNQSRLFLSTGDEQRQLRYFNAAPRLNIGKRKSLEAETRIGEKSTLAKNFSTRNFDIRFVETQPKINFQFSRKFRLSVAYEFKHKKNFSDSLIVNSTVNLHKAILESKWNLKDRNNLFTRLEFIQVRQEGSPGFAADYELRDGLQPGFNAIWQAFFTWYLFKNVEMSLTYDGRAARERKVIHSGRMQIRAFF